MIAGGVAGLVGDAETHGLQHRGVALVERHLFFAHGSSQQCWLADGSFLVLVR